MPSVIIGAIIFFLILPVVFRLLGWRGARAQVGLIIIGGLYLLYSWFIE